MAETTQAVQAKPKRGMSKSLRDSLVAYSFIAPNFIGFCIFTLVPMIFAIGLSFCNWMVSIPLSSPASATLLPC